MEAPCVVYAKMTRLERMERHLRELVDLYNDIVADYHETRFLVIEPMTVIARGSDDRDKQLA